MTPGSSLANRRNGLGRCAAGLVLFASGCGSGLDTVPATHDVQANAQLGASPLGENRSATRPSGTLVEGSSVSDASVPSGAASSSSAERETYEHVSKRKHGRLALAESRGFAVAQATLATERLADAFESCAADRERDGKLVAGAVRIVVRVNEAGEIDGWNVRAAPGPAVAAIVLLCIVAPLKAATFGPGAVRGFALESEWSPVPAPR